MTSGRSCRLAGIAAYPPSAVIQAFVSIPADKLVR
jgi:hypothetical protein